MQTGGERANDPLFPEAGIVGHGMVSGVRRVGLGWRRMMMMLVVRVLGRMFHSRVWGHSLPWWWRPNVVVEFSHIVIVGSIEKHISPNTREAPIHRWIARVLHKTWSLGEFWRVINPGSLPVVHVIFLWTTPT